MAKCTERREVVSSSKGGRGTSVKVSTYTRTVVRCTGVGMRA
jgi:hypothetical protein